MLYGVAFQDTVKFSSGFPVYSPVTMMFTLVNPQVSLLVCKLVNKILETAVHTQE